MEAKVDKRNMAVKEEKFKERTYKQIKTESDVINLRNSMAKGNYPLSMDDMINRLTIYSENDLYKCFCALYDNKIVGFVSMVIYELFVAKRKKIKIEGLIVDKKLHRHGIGTLLMQHVKQYAKDHHISVIDLTSGKRRAKNGTHDFYRKLGYCNKGPRAKVYFRKDLSPKDL